MRSLILTSMFVAAAVNGGEDGPIQWRTDFTKAAIEAQEKNKLLFINVHAEWCGPCKEMHRTTFQDARLADAVNRDCIPVSIDQAGSEKLLKLWRVEHFPTTMIVGTTGTVRSRVLSRMEGKVGVAEIMESLQRSMRAGAAGPVVKTPARAPARGSAEMGRDGRVTPASAVMPAGNRNSTVNGAPDEPPQPRQAFSKGDKPTLQPPSPTEAEPVSSRSPADDASMRKSKMDGPAGPRTPATLAPALDGCCPVTMIERGEMTPGRTAEFQMHQGKKYLFASAEHRKLFAAAPERYLPGAGGACVVSLVESGKSVEGDARFPAMFGDRVFFLSSKSTQEKFLKDPRRFVSDKGEPKPAVK